MTIEELAKIGYDAYGNEAEWKSFDGKPMPKWEDLPQHIRHRWKVAAGAIFDAIVWGSPWRNGHWKCPRCGGNCFGSVSTPAGRVYACHGDAQGTDTEQTHPCGFRTLIQPNNEG